MPGEGQGSMRLHSILPVVFVALLPACGGAIESESSVVGFETEDATYALGAHATKDGKRVVTEIVEDASSSYLTPQSPNTSWIVDRALAHTQQRALMLDAVAVRGLYVRDCVSNEWINANHTPFAPQAELLQWAVNGEYVLGHFYANTELNGFLSDRFDCSTEPASFARVMTAEGERDVQRVGDVSFAYVVDHY
jgi:hypothetical protein